MSVIIWIKKSTKKLSKSIKSNQTMQVIIQKSDRARIHIFFMEVTQAKCIQLRIYSRFLWIAHRETERDACIHISWKLVSTLKSCA